MIGYVTVGTNDLDRARSYYDALFGSIGGKRLMQLDDQRGFTMYGVAMNRPGVVVTRPYDGGAADPGNDPGFRGDPEFGYYFAYFRDPDGNKFAVFNIAPQP
jgi:catechol 2,3-dioxygenase-like lactoylglutathione lyase family enzyme